MEHAFFHLFLLLCSSPSNPNAWKSQRMQLHTLTAISASRRDAVNLAWPPVYASAASAPDMDGLFFQPPFLWLTSDIRTKCRDAARNSDCFSVWQLAGKSPA